MTPIEYPGLGIISEDEILFLKILAGDIPPAEGPYLCGWFDHAAGRPFRLGRFDFPSPDGLSWRLGWNARALVTSGL